MTPRPQLDHFTGREVVEVGVHHEGEGGVPPTWYIELEGGARIYSNRPLADDPAPDEDALMGLVLRTITLGNDVNVLYFAKPVRPGAPMEVAPIGVALLPTKYTISHPDYKGGEPVQPQSPDIQVGTPPHPDDRVATTGQPEPDAESDKVAEYQRLIDGGLSDGEARATVWPEPTADEVRDAVHGMEKPPPLPPKTEEQS